MKKTGTTILCLALFLVLAVPFASAGTDIVGVWKNADSETGKAKFHVRIWERDGVYYGKIENDPDAAGGERCADCDGSKKYRPLAGLVMLWGMKKSPGKEDGCDVYAGGRILDIETGKDYPCTMLVAGDNKMRVRRYVLFFYRTRYWYRVR